MAGRMKESLCVNYKRMRNLTVVTLLSLVFTSCGLRWKIERGLPDYSPVKAKYASKAIHGYFKQSNLKGPYSLIAIDLRKDNALFLVKRWYWEYGILVDKDGKVLESYLRLDRKLYHGIN